MTPINLDGLKQNIPYKWKIQSFNADKTKGSCVAYIDARDVMDLLDKVVGGANWKDEYRYENNQWLCGLSIKIEGEWVTKWDTGTAGDFEAEKSAISDSFKRAGVKWGIGRFLYDLEIKWIECTPNGKSAYPVDDKGKRIWDLTKHFANGGKTTNPDEYKKDNPVQTEEVRFCAKHNIKMTKFASATDPDLTYFAHIGTQGTKCYGK